MRTTVYLCFVPGEENVPLLRLNFVKQAKFIATTRNPKHLGGGDEYGNLTLVHELVHRLIHATQADTVTRLLQSLSLNNKQIGKVNELRKMAGLRSIYQMQKTNNL